MQRYQDYNLPVVRKTMAELQTQYSVIAKTQNGKLEFELTQY